MNDINSTNAVMRERARIREKLVKLSTVELDGAKIPLVSRADVLRIISDEKEN